MDNKPLLKNLGFFLFLLLSILSEQILSAGTAVKDFYFPRLKADLYVQKDGSFQVDEYLTFEFKGDFSWASLWIPLVARKNLSSLPIEITEFRIQDETGKDLPLETVVSNGKFQARWQFRARNERRTFHITYRVNKAILNYPDGSELYWQIIGNEVERPTVRAEVIVHLPEQVQSRDDILIYGHGPLSGQAEILDLKTFRFVATNIPSHQIFEIRVIWPAGMVNGIPVSGYSKEKIKQEEAEYVQKTIQAINKARESEEKKQRILELGATIWIVWQIIGPLLWLGLYLYFWEKIGKDYKFDDIPEYYREIPSRLPPALVQVLRREGQKIQPVAFTATIFDLARRGYLEIRDEQVPRKTLLGNKLKTETVFILKKPYKQETELKPFEKQVLEFLFETIIIGKGEPGIKARLEDMINYMKKVPAEFQLFFRQWSKEIDQEAKKLEFIEPESQKAYTLFLAISLPLGIITLSPVLIILVLILSPRLKRRKKEWAKENELWKALERFLHDFSDFKEIPPEAYKLWDQYLVFAILFGQAKKLIKMLPLILQNEQTTNTGWLFGAAALSSSSMSHNVDSITAVVNSIEKVANTISQASTSAAHYSSGGGGGFSGGGGGGGGGGGVSAG
ncbi:MAG: DUF2207 domain-containing protein [Candidatus Aminicenantes bacterium]|nr:DUF2207 domain-containing protein [Candidatus Aminicenantes bacterium]